MITLLASSRRDGSGVSARSDWYLRAMEHIEDGRFEDKLALGLCGVLLVLCVVLVVKAFRR